MSDKKILPERSDIADQDCWAIHDLYPSDEAWQEELALLKTKTAEAAAFQGRLTESADTLLAYLDLTEELALLIENLINYAQRQSDVDSRVAKYQAMVGEIMSAYVACRSATAFENPELLAMDESRMDSFYKANPGLEKYRRYLNTTFRFRPHTLSQQEEALLAAAGELSQSPDTIFGMFNDADLTFPDAVDSNGKSHTLTSGSYIALLQSPDRCLRRSAFENLYHSYGAFGNTLAAVQQAEVKQRRFFAEARHYSSSLEASLYANDVPVEVYTNLIQTVHDNMDKMERYVRLRKQRLGLDERHMSDLYTPLVDGVDKDIPFDEAKETVSKALSCLGENYQAILKEGFENRWIDVYENAGKRSGAYSAGTMVHPYVLLNYNGTLDSMFTLAHEMGHAIHSYLSNKHQAVIDHDYVIFVAEVASTCNEALLMEYLLGRCTDKKERAYLINHFLEQFRATLYRQTMFAEFELIIGELEAQGVALTKEKLNEEYRKLNRLYFGPEIILDPEIDCEWMRIPHFYYNYYVFQYATGYAAAIALSRRILREGTPAVEDYLKFLSGGCSASPIDLLKIAGVDMSSPQPVADALALFDQLLDEMEALVSE
ncbi:MAG: oligoendopeptidase F [Oscillospiraceae bacterium]|nr:oligoendopeptidase F [Oscillospiraceae bacterium]